MPRPKPFSPFEFMIAWRYLRARRAEGGVSIMTWISLLGITLAVFALIATMAVRAGFRAELVDTILGANAHVSVIGPERVEAETGARLKGFPDDGAVTTRLASVDGVTRAAPMIRGQVMVTAGDGAFGGDVYGMTLEDLKAIPRIGTAAEDSWGNIEDYPSGLAMGSALARDLGVTVGDRVRLISPNGSKTAMGASPRVKAYSIAYVFTAGRWDIDNTRIYLPFTEAQSFFNREGLVDEIEVMLAEPEGVDALRPALQAAAPDGFLWSWQDASGSYLRALTIEDNVMFIIMAILVLIASLNIVSGLIMLVKNKGRDIGILRTMGLTEGAVLRVFFLCGAFTGTVGTLAGVALGCLFAIYIDPIFSFVNAASGGGVWDPSIRGIYYLPARLQAGDVISAVALSLGLSFIVTIFPARKAARMNPVEALRYE